MGDEHADPEFGTGVVKITPAHDPNDFLVGQRHNLPQVNVMNDDGTMNDLAFEFVGMDRFEARKAVVAKLEEIGALVKIEKRVHSVGHSERTGVVVEPRLSTQWFVKMDQLAKNAIANQDTEDKVEFYPPRFNDTFLQWMENVHDWVISRQLWWGHQIPAWYNAEGEMYVGEEAPEGDGWTQDEDAWILGSVLPLAILNYGWPDVDSEDFKRYLPNFNLGNRLRYHLLLGVSYDFPIIGIHRPSAIPKTSLSTVSSVTSKDARCLSLSVTGLTQWMLSRNTVPMPYVGSFQTVLHQAKTCASLTRKWMLHGTSLTRSGTSRATFS